MDTSIHSLIAAQYVQERMAEATGARAARELRRRRPRRSWTLKLGAARRPLLPRRVRPARLP